MMSMLRARILLAAFMAAATAACGSTVAPSQLNQAVGGGTGLGPNPPGAVGGIAPGSELGPAQEPGGFTGSGAAPGTGSSGPGGAPTNQVGPNAPTGSGSSPAAAVSGPLKIGVLDAKSPAAAASATGAGNAAGVDPAELTRAFIAYYNERGGMAGRKLEPIEYTIDPTSASYESDLSAACERFTNDNHVRLVVSQTGNIFSSNYESCLTKAGITNLEVGNGAPDQRSLQMFPRLYTTGSPTVDRRIAAQLRGLTGTGLLTRGAKIGVIVEDCPDNTRAYEQTLVPLARSLGFTLVRRGVDCVAGFNDAGKFFAQVGSAVLPYNSDDVMRVMFMTSFEVAAVQAFENQAQAQAYSPSYVLSSISSTAVQAGQYPASALQRMFGVGWIPVLDTTGVPQAKGVKRCRDIASSGGHTINSQGDYAFLLQICDLFAVLDGALVAARGSDEAAAFSAGLGTAMASYQSVNVLGGRLRLGGNAHDGPPVFATFGYVGSCSCFRYTGQQEAMA